MSKFRVVQRNDSEHATYYCRRFFMWLIGRPVDVQRGLGLPNVIIKRYLEVLAEMVALMM
jgi:hypothetical protein